MLPILLNPGHSFCHVMRICAAFYHKLCNISPRLDGRYWFKNYVWQCPCRGAFRIEAQLTLEAHLQRGTCRVDASEGVGIVSLVVVIPNAVACIHTFMIWSRRPELPRQR
jgi:hypothetical protein